MKETPGYARKRRILVVDDEEDILLLYRETFESQYEVTVCSSGEQAIQAVSKSMKHNDPFTVVITDLGMPELNGFETAEKIREMDARIHLIMVTGQSEDLIKKLPVSLKDNLILMRKPFSVAELSMLTQYLSKTWHLDRVLEAQTVELQAKNEQTEGIRDRLAAIVETSLDCIITIDHQGKITEWNPAAEITFGFKKDDILGERLSQTIIPNGLRSAYENGMKTYLVSGHGPILGKRIEIEALHADGHHFPVELAVTPVKTGKHPSFTAYLRDISTQRNAEQQMRLQSKTLEAAANGIIITNADSRMVWANPAFLKLTGYAMDEVIGEKMSLLKSDLHSKAYYDDLWTTIKAGKVWQGEIMNKRRDGSHYTEEMTITPVTDAEGEIQNYIAIKQDVTERKNASDMVRRSAESQRVINYFSTLLSMSNDVEEILWDITSNCISEMGLEDAVIYLFESDSDVLLQRAAYGKSKARDNQIINPLRIPLGQGIVGTVAKTACEMMIQDVSKDDRHIADIEIRGSELAVPIIFENKVIGVLDSEHSETNFFNDHHLTIFKAIASLAANKIMRSLSVEELQNSESRYRKVFESIIDVYSEVDLESGIITEISPSVERVYGYTREELVGKSILPFYGEHGLPVELVELLHSNRKVNDFQSTLIDKHGLPIVSSFSGKIVCDENGKDIVVGIFRDISERADLEIELDYRLAFEHLVSSISSKFLQLPTQQAEIAINSALQEIGQFIKVARAYVFIFSDDNQVMNNTNEWCAPGVNPEKANLQGLPVEIFPWWMEQIRQNHVVSIPNVDELPEIATAEKEILSQQSIKSLLALPIESSNGVIGFVGFDAVQDWKEWNSTEVSLLLFIAGIMGSAIQRSRDFSTIKGSQEQLKLALKAANLGFWDWKSDSANVRGNEIWMTILGYTQSDLNTGTLVREDLIHPEEKDLVRKKWADFLTEETQDYQVEYRMMAKGGGWKWISDFGQIIERDELGNPLRVVGIHMDITTRINRENKLHQNQERLSLILSSLPVGVVISDSETGLILMVNPAAEVLIGSTTEEILGKRATTLFETVVAKHKYKIAQSIIVGTEYNLIQSDGRRLPVLKAAVPMMLSGQKQILESFVDIQSHIEAEHALKENLKARNAFVSNVTHELRTPLASILGFSSTILRDKNMPEDTRMEFIKIIFEESQRLTRLIENVLDIAKIEAGSTNYKLAPLLLYPPIMEVIESQSILAVKKGVVLETEVNEDTPLVLGAKDALNQLAINLISNAIKFTEPGGKIFIRLKTASKHSILEVEDTGLGIPEADIPKIFDKFFRVNRAKREDPGTGIGLAIVKEIVDLHGATIDVKSKVGKGTIFRIVFPELAE